MFFWKQITWIQQHAWVDYKPILFFFNVEYFTEENTLEVLSKTSLLFSYIY